MARTSVRECDLARRLVYHAIRERVPPKRLEPRLVTLRDPKISGHIPDWFGQAVPAETFILFPLVIRNTPVGLIYADKARAGELLIPENILSLLRALRNQAVLAIKQSR